MDPMIILNKYDNYLEFLIKIKEVTNSTENVHNKILMFISKELTDGKRLTEILLLKELLDGQVNKFEFQKKIRGQGYLINDYTMNSIIRRSEERRVGKGY